MTPWDLAKDTEHSQQRALFAWANCVAEFGFVLAANPACYVLQERRAIFAAINGNVPFPVPELSLLFAIHNQGHGDRIRGAQAKAEGVKAGVPDLMLPVRSPWFACPGLFIEMKKLKKGVTSEAQAGWGIELQAQGYGFRVCKGWIEAANCIGYYLTGKQEVVA